MKEVFQAAEHKMDKTVQVLTHEYASIRAGRANPGVLDKIMVDYYGTPTPINQLAAVSVTEARTLTVQPWDVSVAVSYTHLDVYKRQGYLDQRRTLGKFRR